MPIVVMLIGFIYFITYVIREWSTPAIVDNAMLISSYANTAIFGMWIMLIGFVWQILRKS